MLNNVVLIGQVVDLNDNFIKLSVQRNYKNDLGIYENDIIPCKLNNNLYDRVKKYCQKNDALGLKARIEILKNEVNVVVEKVTFLTSRPFKGGF